MLFNSLLFLLFFPAVAFLNAIVPHRYRWPLLLAASYAFYMAWHPAYILLIVASTLVDYFAAHRMAATDDKRRRKLYLALSLTSNLGLLAVFKYYNFFNDTVIALFGGSFLPKSELLLPVGISFYTFQTLAYSIDVYRGNLKPERHLGLFALYVSFFPQLVAGPIERAQNLLPQFRKRVDFDERRVIGGLKLMAWGMFKKVVIADHLALIVNDVFNHSAALGGPASHSGPALLIAAVFFAFQIYCDFSGYSDIAIGCAQVLGFSLMDNFKRPYSATSVGDFWRRWHISLSTWFRDYVYLPLGGNRVKTGRWILNVTLVFGLSGLWHGAAWTFVIWGLLHAFYLICGRLTTPLRAASLQRTGLAKLPWLTHLWAVLSTFILVDLAWIFFRANSLTDALAVIGNLHRSWDVLLTDGAFARLCAELGTTQNKLLFAFGFILFLEFVHLIQSQTGIRRMLGDRAAAVRWPLYTATIVGVFFFGVFGDVPFIYFQF